MFQSVFCRSDGFFSIFCTFLHLQIYNRVFENVLTVGKNIKSTEEANFFQQIFLFAQMHNPRMRQSIFAFFQVFTCSK